MNSRSSLRSYRKDENMQQHKNFLLMCVIFMGCAAPGFAAAADDGAKIFEDSCSDCHNGKKKPLENKHMTRKEWQEAINAMIGGDRLDPVPSKEKMSILLDWLVTNRGPVNPAAAVKN